MKKEILVPAAGESVTEADIASWYKSSGDQVSLDEPIVALETDKATMDLAANATGTLTITVSSGTVKVGQVIGYVTEGAAAPKKEAAEKPVEKAAPAPEAPAPQAQKSEVKAPAAPAAANAPKFMQSSYAEGHPSPSAERILSEKGIAASQVQGTGPGGRITTSDAQNATPKATTSTEANGSTPTESTSTKSAPGERSERVEPMTRLRKTVMRRLVEVQHTGALLTTFNEVDMSAVMAIRKQYKDAFKEKYNVNLGFMSFFTKAVCNALLEFPIVNASIEGESIRYHNYCDIGIAVSTPRGLVVPVIRNAESLGFHDIENAIKMYAGKGKDGKITMDEMTGGTFTITNGGTFGSMLSTPIVNAPQSAILGMHNIVERPVAVNGQVVIRPIMYVALTYDHRLIDGADSVRFLVRVKEQLEDPTRLLIQI